MNSTHKKIQPTRARAIAIVGASRRLSKTVMCVVVLAALIAIAPSFASAQTTQSFEITGWLPYWRSASSTKDVMLHLDLVTEVNPFVYTLKNDGTLVDNGKLDEEPWKSFIAEAKKKNVRVIPTIMNGSGETIHALLSDAKSRIALEDAIAKEVKDKGFDGIDIDFEGKKYETREFFSLFLQGLNERLGNKWLMCTIEARTPIADRYYGTDIPLGAGLYANDFKAINRYCDRVRIMTYDLQRGDQRLAAVADDAGQLYAPVSDPTWVEKVIKITTQEIDKNKILIGIPTYGYEYSVTAYANNEYLYDILWTFNPGYATEVVNEYGVTPSRAPWGEMHLTHVKDASKGATAPTASQKYSALAAAAAASQYANSGNKHLDFRYLVWPDSVAIQQKMELAKRMGVRGVSFFKWDGGEDQKMWDVIALERQQSPVVNATTVAPVPSVTTGGASSFTRALSLGSTGEDVRLLQKVLNGDPATQVAVSGAGSPGSETTRFGPATEAAVKKFQVKYGIAKSGSAGYGYVGPATRAKLNTLIP